MAPVCFYGTELQHLSAILSNVFTYFKLGNSSFETLRHGEIVEISILL